MGKNQGYKSMQRARYNSGSGSSAPTTDDGEGGGASSGQTRVDGYVDGSWHSPEYHAMRLKQLAVPEQRMSWEEYKDKRKAEADAEAGDFVAMKRYRAELDADREKRLKGIKKSKRESEKKEKKHSKKKSKKEKKEKKSKEGSKSKKKKEKEDDKSDDSSSASDSDGPVKLSDFFKNFS